MALSEKRKGELYIFSAATLGGFLPIGIALTYAQVSSFVSLAWSTLFAAVFFAFVITYRGRWNELRNPLLWKYSVFITLFIGILFYGFYFSGLEYSTPGNVSIIILFQICTSFVFFNIYRKESILPAHILGAALMIVGALIILGRDFGGINVGDVLILCATFFAPFGNYFQQEARKIASSDSIMFLRSALSAIALFAFLYLFSVGGATNGVWAALPLLLLNGIVFLGFEKMLWIEGIHRVSVTKATALVSITPLVTLLLAWIILHQLPNMWQLASLVPLILGVLFLTDHLKFRTLRKMKNGVSSHLLR